MMGDQNIGKKGGLTIEELKALTSRRIAQGQVCVKNGSSSSARGALAVGNTFNAPHSTSATQPSPQLHVCNNMEGGIGMAVINDGRVYRPSSPSESSVCSTASSSSFATSQASNNQIGNAPSLLQSTSSHRPPQQVQTYNNRRGNTLQGYNDDNNSNSLVGAPISRARGGAPLTMNELKKLTKQRLEREQQKTTLSQMNPAQSEFGTMQAMAKPYAPPAPPPHTYRTQQMPSPLPIYDDRSDSSSNSIHVLCGLKEARVDTIGESSTSRASSDNTQTYASAPMTTTAPRLASQNARTFQANGIYYRAETDLTSPYHTCSSSLEALNDKNHFSASDDQQKRQRGQQSFATSSSPKSMSARDSCLDDIYMSVPTMQKTNLRSKAEIPSSSSLSTSSKAYIPSSDDSGVLVSMFNRPKLSVAAPPNIKTKAIEESTGISSSESFMKSKEGGRMFRKSLLSFLESDSELDDSCHSLDISRHSLDRSRRSLDTSRHSLDGSRHSIGKISKLLAPFKSSSQDDELRSSHNSNGPNSPPRSWKSLGPSPGLLTTAFSVSSDKTVSRDPLDVSHHVNR